VQVRDFATQLLHVGRAAEGIPLLQQYLAWVDGNGAEHAAGRSSKRLAMRACRVCLQSACACVWAVLCLNDSSECMGVIASTELESVFTTKLNKVIAGGGHQSIHPFIMTLFITVFVAMCNACWPTCAAAHVNLVKALVYQEQLNRLESAFAQQPAGKLELLDPDRDA
jgi:hypothetical protein